MLSFQFFDQQFSFGSEQVIAFVAPKIIGGATAPSPVGDMGMVEMTQALNLTDVSFEQVKFLLVFKVFVRV